MDKRNSGLRQLGALPYIFGMLAWLVCSTGARAFPTTKCSTRPNRTSGALAPASIEVSHDEERRFSTFLTAFTERAHAVLIVEGEPLRHSLTDDAALKRLPIEGSAVDILEAVSLAYDYKVVRGKPHGTVYLLEKQYTDPTDVPPITIEEVAGAVTDSGRLVGQFDPNIGIFATPLVQTLYSTLLPEQIGAMVAPDGGLSIDQLTADQRGALHRLVEFSFTSRIAVQIGQVIRHMSDLQNKRATVGWSTSIKNLRLFGYTPHGPLETKSFSDFRPLSDPAVFASVTGYGAVWSALGPMVLHADDPTNPDILSNSIGLSTNAAVDPATEAPLAVTLREAIAALQRPQLVTTADHAGAPATAPQPTFEVADSLAAKTIIVANSQAAASEDVVRGIAALYGLSVKTDFRNGATRLDRPRLPKMERLSDLQPALLDVFPTPFFRAMHWEAKIGQDREITDLSDRLQALNRLAASNTEPDLPDDTAASKAAIGRELLDALNRLVDLQAPARGHQSDERKLRNGAVKRLRADVEPVLVQRKTDMLPLAALGYEPHFALASVLLTDLYTALSGRMAGTPRFVTNEDQLVLRAVKGQFIVPGSNGGMRPGLRITLYYRDINGAIIQAGAGYVAFPDGTECFASLPDTSP